MTRLKDEDEIAAYYIEEPLHPRAAAVMWPAIIERRIDKLYETALRPDARVKNELLQPSGALANYAVKVRLAYLLGWIEEDIYKDLLLIAKIRNLFAHSLDVKDFDDQRISAWLRNMKSYRFIPGMVERLREKARSDPSTENECRAYTASGLLEDDIMAFRFCVRQMIFRLEEAQRHMEKNLSDKPGNWLVT